jgi:hypothetical protein
MAGNLGLTQQDVLEFVLQSLGAPSIDVHVTPAQIQNFMDQVVLKLSKSRPLIKWSTLAARAGVQNYTPNPGTLGFGIVTVGVPRIDPIAPLLLSAGPKLDIFGYRYSYPYRDISELEIDYIYFDMATRVLSAEIDWEFINGQIWITPMPVDSFQFSYAYSTRKRLGDLVSGFISTIRPQEEDVVKDAVLGYTQQLEGRILRRYGQIPGATASLATDGSDMVADGDAAVDKFQKWLDNCPELPFMKSGSPADLPLTI